MEVENRVFNIRDTQRK